MCTGQIKLNQPNKFKIALVSKLEILNVLRNSPLISELQFDSNSVAHWKQAKSNLYNLRFQTR